MGMSREEECDLVLRAQAGDREALARLVQEHERHIRYLAMLYRCRGLTVRDQFQNGVEVLLRKLRDFDPEKGTRLSTYAQKSIVGAMIKACAKQLGLSEEARKAYRHIKSTYRQLQQDQLAEPTVEQVAAYSNIPIRVVREVFDHCQRLTVQLPEEGEGSEEGARRIVPPSLQEQSSEHDLVREDEIEEGFGAVFQRLGKDNGTKFLVLAVLREGVSEDNARGYDWAEIAALLADPYGGPSPPWNERLLADFPHLPVLPTSWEKVCALFSPPPPTRTEQALKQWYSRMLRRLRNLD